MLIKSFRNDNRTKDISEFSSNSTTTSPRSYAGTLTYQARNFRVTWVVLTSAFKC
jgi:hypothetical protein